MSKQVPWNNVLLEEFIRIGALTEDEEKVLRARVKGYSIVKQSELLGYSIATIQRITKRLKVKYDHCQKHSDILPPRKFSVEETYCDHKMIENRNKKNDKTM